MLKTEPGMTLTMDNETVRYSLEKHMESYVLTSKGDDGRIYAAFQSLNGKEIAPVDSPRFETWLIEYCLDAGFPPNMSAVRLAIAAVKAKKWVGSESVCVRVGSYNGDVYWDISDQTGKAVRMTPEGWSLVEEPKVLFPSHPNRRPLVEPEKGGSIHLMRNRFGLSAENEALLLSFCLGCLKGHGPYPLAIIVGLESSERTALLRYIRELLDPSAPALRNLPKNEEELAVTARDNYLMAYDDVTTVPSWLETGICKLIKGTAFSKCSRSEEKILFQGARPVILAGDEDLLLNRELASRALIVRLERNKALDPDAGTGLEDHAHMRGAMLDIVCHGLGRLQDVKISDPVRDYNFEKWIEACDLPRWGLGSFQPAYEANVSDGRRDIVELDPVLITLREYMLKVGTFRGTFGQLLQELNSAVSIRRGNRWPENPRALSGRLRRDAKLLPEIEFDFDIPKQGHNRDRIVAAKVKFSDVSPVPKHGEGPTTQNEELAGPSRKNRGKKRAAVDQPMFL
jgi:hypothetical protein